MLRRAVVSLPHHILASCNILNSCVVRYALQVTSRALQTKHRRYLMRSTDVIATLEELGSSQWGLVTTGQAEAYGISRVALGRLRDGHIIHQVRRGIWALPSADHGPLQGLRAAWLSTSSRQLAEERLHGESDIVVSHISAASVHALGDLIPQQHEFTSAKRRQTTQADLRFHRAPVDGDVTIVGGLPVTSIPRTVEDLAKTGVDLDHLATIIRDALASPDVRLRHLADRLGAAAARHGYEDGGALVEDSLERAGVPAVAVNLSGSHALAKILAQQNLPTFQTAILEELARQLVTPELRAAVSSAVGAALAAQTQLPLASAGNARQHLQLVAEEALAPFLEQNARASQSLVEDLRASLRSPPQRPEPDSNKVRGLDRGHGTPPVRAEGGHADSSAEDGGET